MKALSFLTVLTIAVLGGCSTVDGQGRYRVESIGNAQRSVDAVVISARPAYIQYDTTGRGSTLGGLAGGGLAANSDNAGVIIAGIVGGILIGDAIEGMNNVYNATEYVIKTSKEAIFTVAQIDEGNPIFVAGNKVILVYGYPSRLIPSPD
ncbi:hypothetical protein [Parahaliea mediterranea]|uniref:hypothetical protein n=1 Tax=Parahaliea mediterranea TaxID=651086 RepID=UPI00130064ED|nr:hypothetical protein [Parahaliea mediterranea]